MSIPRLYLVAAGSGGHILPALQLGMDWLEKNPGGIIVLFTSRSKLDKKIAAQYPRVRIERFWLGAFPGKRLWRYPFFAIGLCATFCKAFMSFYRRPASLLISTGGYLSVPILYAARFFRFEKHLYELNVIPGRATEFVAHLTSTLFVLFDRTHKLFGKHASKCRRALYPLRYKTKENAPCKKDVIARVAQSTGVRLCEQKKTLFVLGGSQGSVQLNDLVKSFFKLANVQSGAIQVIHQSPAGQVDQLRSLYQKRGIDAIVFSYRSHIKPLYQLADLVVCRAGAGTLFELAHFEKKAIVIPLRARSTSHQMDNAREFKQLYPELFTILDSKGLPDRMFSDVVKRLL